MHAIRKSTHPVALAISVAGTVFSLQPATAAIPASTTSELPCGGSVTVVAGDTIGSIAEFCGVSVASLQAVNPELGDPDAIHAGQRIEVPGAAPVDLLGPDRLEEILAPVALYPDALLAEILPAATYPLEVVQAERWLKAGNDPNGAESEDWAPSVKALVHYPEVVSMMSNDLDWTIEVGDAFLAQPDDVFSSIQTLRARASESGNLKSDDYQSVVEEPAEVVEVVEAYEEPRTIIRIVPAVSSRIYVPYYDSYWAYQPYGVSHRYYGSPLFHYSSAYVLGSWFSHYLDWHHHSVRIYPRHYRTPYYYRAPSMRAHFNTRYWNPWRHQPIHRRGYRYHAQPRVRIAEGQRRHMNYSSPRRNLTGAGPDQRADRRARNRVLDDLNRSRARPNREGRSSFRANPNVSANQSTRGTANRRSNPRRGQQQVGGANANRSELARRDNRVRSETLARLNRSGSDGNRRVNRNSDRSDFAVRPGSRRSTTATQPRANQSRFARPNQSARQGTVRRDNRSNNPITTARAPARNTSPQRRSTANTTRRPAGAARTRVQTERRAAGTTVTINRPAPRASTSGQRPARATVNRSTRPTATRAAPKPQARQQKPASSGRSRDATERRSTSRGNNRAARVNRN